MVDTWIDVGDECAGLQERESRARCLGCHGRGNRRSSTTFVVAYSPVCHLSVKSSPESVGIFTVGIFCHGAETVGIFGFSDFLVGFFGWNLLSRLGFLRRGFFFRGR